MTNPMTDNSAETAATGSKLLQDLIQLRSSIPVSDTASVNERQRTYQNVGGFILRAGRLDDLIRAVTIATKDDYKAAIDDELVMIHLGIASGDAKGDLNKIIDWHVQVSLDPRVSSAAQALIDKGSAATVSRDREAPTPEMLEAGRIAWMNRNLKDPESDPIRDCYMAMDAIRPSAILSLNPVGSGAEAMREIDSHLSVVEQFDNGKPDWRVIRVIPEQRIVLSRHGSNRGEAEAAYKALAALPVPGKQSETCPQCKGSGFSGYGSGYDSVCGHCGGLKALPTSEAPPATNAGDGPTHTCKRAGGFVDSNCLAMCDCHETMKIKSLSPVQGNGMQTRCVQPVLSGNDGSEAKSPTVKDLIWSDIFPPSIAFFYDHCWADTAVGSYRVEWKSGKEHDSCVLYRDDEFINCFTGPDEAKLGAQNDFTNIVRRCLISAAPASLTEGDVA